MSLEALFSALGENNGILLLTGLFIFLCLTLLVAYFWAMKPKAGTIEWISLYGKGEGGALTLHSLNGRDLPAFLLCIFLSGGIFVLRMLLHILRGYIPSTQWEGPAMLLRGLLLPFLLCSCCYFLFRMIYGYRSVTVLLSVLACSLTSSGAKAHMLLAASLACLYIWVCLNNRKPKAMDTVWLLVSALLYGLCLMVCWAAFYLIPIYVAGYIVGKVYQWHQGEEEKRKERLILSCGALLIGLGIGTVTLWLLYYIYTHENFYLWNVLLSGETYREMVPTFINKIYDITLPRGQSVPNIFGDIYTPILFLSSLPPLIHGIVKKRNSHAIMVGICILPFLLMWAISGVELMTFAYLLSIGWMFRGFEDRDKKVFAIIGSIAVILFYFMRILLV